MTSSTSPSAVADLERGTITRTVRIAAPPAVVWKALTTPGHVAEWWGLPMRFPDGIEEGAVGRFEWSEGDIHVRIDRLDESQRYALTWGSRPDLDDETATSVVFDLVEDEDTTVVTVTESGFDRRTDVAERRAAMEQNTEGWNLVLDGLASYCEDLAA